MIDFFDEYHNGDGLEFSAHDPQKKPNFRLPSWTLIKQKTLQTNQLIMESTNISNENEQLENEISSLKSDIQDIQRKYNIQLEKATKLELDKVENEKLMLNYKREKEKKEIELEENKKRFEQLVSKIEMEECKNKKLEELVKSSKAKVTKKKSVPTKHQGCQTTNSIKQDISVNTDPVQLNPIKPEMKDFSANANFIEPIQPRPQMKDFSATANFIEPIQPRLHMKDFSATANFIKPIPPKPLMIDKNEWTDECITISKEPFPIFCSKCKSYIHPAPINQILKIMTASPPVPLSLVPSPPNSPKVKIPFIKQIDKQDKNVIPMKNIEEPECSAISIIKNLTKRITKLEKSVKIIKKSKKVDNSNGNCCQKNIKFVVQYPDAPKKCEKRENQKKLKRLNKRRLRSKQDDRSRSNKWVVESSKPKKVKVLHPKLKKPLKLTLPSQSKVDDWFESPEVVVNEKSSIESPRIMDENSCSSNVSSISLNNEEKSGGDESEEMLETVNISKSKLFETEALDPSQISLYKYTYPNNVGKDLDQNLVNNVQFKEKSSTCEGDLLSAEASNEKRIQEVVVNKQDIIENNLRDTLPHEQNSVDSEQVIVTSSKSALINKLPSCKKINYLADENNMKEDQIIIEKSRENNFSNILSYPIIFGESDVSEEELAVCDNIKNQENFISLQENLPNNQEFHEVPQITYNLMSDFSNNKSGKDLKEIITKNIHMENETFVDKKSFDDKTLSKDTVYASPVSNSVSTALYTDIESNKSTPHNIPSSSGIPITPEYTSTTPVAYKTFQAKVLFMEPNDVTNEIHNSYDNIDNSESLKNNAPKCVPLSLNNNKEEASELQKESGDRISQFLPISRLSGKPKVPGLSEPRTKLRIRGNKIESKLGSSEFSNSNFSCPASINSRSKENSEAQQSNVAVNESKSKSNVAVFVIPENVLDQSLLKDKIKNKKHTASEQKNDNSESNEESKAVMYLPISCNGDKHMKENNVDDDTSFEELDFNNVHDLPILTTKKDYPVTPHFCKSMERKNSCANEEVDHSRIVENGSSIENSDETEKFLPIENSVEKSNTIESDGLIESDNSSSLVTKKIEENHPQDIHKNDSTVTESDDKIEENNKNEVDKIDSVEKKMEPHSINTMEEKLIKTKESICKSSEESLESEVPSLLLMKRKKSSEEISGDEETFKIPTKRGRKKCTDSESTTPTISRRKTLLKKIRTLKKTSKISRTTPVAKPEASIVDSEPKQLSEPVIKAEAGVPDDKSEEIIEKSIALTKSPVKLTKKANDTLAKSVAILNHPDNCVIDATPAKKQRIAHKPKNIGTEVELGEPEEKLVQKRKQTKSSRKFVTEADKFLTLFNDYDKICKERAEYSRLQKEKSSMKPFDTVNLTDLITNGSNSAELPINDSSNDCKKPKEKIENSLSEIDEADKACSEPTLADALPSTVRELRSRVVLEENISKARKLPVSRGKKMSKIPDFIDETNSSLDDTSVRSVLNESIFFGANLTKVSSPLKYYRKNKNLFNQYISTLMEAEQWTSEINDNTFKALTDSLDFKTLAMFIIEYIINNLPEDETVDKEHTPPAPLMTRSMQKILVLINSLNKSCPNFIDIVLQGSKYELFRLNGHHEVQIVERLMLLLVSLYKIKKDRDNVRIAICDALYCLKMRAVDAIDIVLSSWPEVLPQFSTDNDIIVKTIVHAIMTLKINKPYAKLTRLRKFLSGFYNYPNCDYSIDNLRADLLNGLRDNVPGVYTAILLICKRMEPEWSARYIIPGIKNILVDPKRSSLFEDFTLLGNILRSFSAANLEKEDETINQLCEILAANAGTDNLQEGIVSCLSSISKFKYEQIALALMKWQSKEELRPSTRDKLFSFFKTHNSGWWWIFIKKNFPLPNQV